MVNYGVSRGCETCKKRRKKCDETRPACNRCTKSRRECPGYKDEGTLLFRQYEPPKVTYASPVCWWAPKVPDGTLEEMATSIFLAEFVVESHDRRHSRGFLDGMQTLLARVSPESSIACAAKLVVLASIGNRTGRESLAERARRQYGRLLQRYTMSLSHESAVVSIESLYTAILLGLYEIIVSSDSSPMQHKAHVEGVCAILRGGVKPFDITRSVQFYSLGNPLVLRTPVGTETSGTGILCAPISHGCLQNLDTTLIQFHTILVRSEDLLSQPSPPLEALLRLEHDALALDSEFIHWGNFECNVWAPKRQGSVSTEGAEASGCTYCCAGSIDKYFDFYVAAVWNSWRKAQLMHIDILMRLAKLLGRNDTVPGYHERAETLVAGLKASIPYYLAVDLHEYLRLANAGASHIPPNRPVGGLLLLHPLYAAARCSILSPADRQYFADTLMWIGRHMGVGQAILLAKSLDTRSDVFPGTKYPELPFMEMSEGHILIWAGMMLEPTSPTRGDVVGTA